jgi:hypothetical protein
MIFAKALSAKVDDKFDVLFLPLDEGYGPFYASQINPVIP